MKLIDYVLAYVTRGACTCGKCCDAPETPEEKKPEGHTVDLTFFTHGYDVSIQSVEVPDAQA